jgi:hypothetical protein
MTSEEAEQAAADCGYYVGDRWTNPRGRTYRILRFTDEDRAVTWDEKSDHEELVLYLLMHPSNGWTRQP